MNYNKGEALASLHRYNEAIVYFDKVLAVNPNNNSILSDKGAALDALGKHNEASTYYD